MERLRKKDDGGRDRNQAGDGCAEGGHRRVRNFYEAKMAEQEVLHQSAVLTTLDPEARAALDAHARRDRERYASERDAKIEKIRKGD